MSCVRKRRRQSVVEYRRRFAEIDAVLLEILLGFLRIPSERHRISVRAVRMLRPGGNACGSPAAAAYDRFESLSWHPTAVGCSDGMDSSCRCGIIVPGRSGLSEATVRRNPNGAYDHRRRSRKVSLSGSGLAQSW